MISGPRSPFARLLLLAAAAFVAYAPTLLIPLIADDYPNIAQARVYGSPAGLSVLFHDAQFRLRATSYWAMFALWRMSQLTPFVCHAFSLALHIANVWLVYAVGMAWPRMRPAALWAAVFFAVHEGHQEAIMWFSAINELWVFFFGMASLLCWLTVTDRERERAWPWQLAGILLFALALLSKESAVVFLPLFFLTASRVDWRRSMVSLLPHLVLTALALASIASARTYSFRFSDGSFSLHAPFWITWPHSLGRILWIWGWLAAVAIVASKDRPTRRAALFAFAWIGIALVPYSFLTYSTGIPSRQTYLASAGLAWVFGLALAHLSQRFPARPRIVTAVVALVLLHNTGYLWTKKRTQFLERAAPTEQLLALARQTPGTIWVRCFPLPALVAEEAVHLALGRPASSLIWSASAASERPPAAVFCYRQP